MYGIGIDMTSVSRIEKSMSKENFREFVFTKKELEMFFETEKPKYKSLAANFRAKEAFSKALGTGVRGFNLNEIEILRDGMGAPCMNFYGRAERIMRQKGLKAFVSLTHEGDAARAFVVLSE